MSKQELLTCAPTNQEKFESAYLNFIPDPTDPKDNIPFYRAFAGLKAAWGTTFYETYNTVIHRCACECGKLPIETRYATILKVLEYFISDWKLPDDPYHWGFYESEPDKPGDKEARELFNRDFKRAYPSIRINSKEAKAKWEELKSKALAVVNNRYQIQLADYKRREALKEKQNREAREEWLGKIWDQAIFENEAQEILKEASCEFQRRQV